MIVRVTFKSNEDKQESWLFGNSYKTWDEQFSEFILRWGGDFKEIEKVEISKSKWKSWGGLKWCDANNFQEELNRENVQDNEPPNPKPRQYKKMRFEGSDSHFEVAQEWFETWKRRKDAGWYKNAK